MENIFEIPLIKLKIKFNNIGILYFIWMLNRFHYPLIYIQAMYG